MKLNPAKIAGEVDVALATTAAVAMAAIVDAGLSLAGNNLCHGLRDDLVHPGDQRYWPDASTLARTV